MGSKLWWFNPWNDLALASNASFYTPPEAAIKLASAGSTIPFWIAQENDFVIVSKEGKDFYKKYASKYKLARPWSGETIECCIPWGWSKAARQFFLDRGINPSLLPSDVQLDTWRSLSHRRTTLKIHEYLDSKIDIVEATSYQDCVRALSQWNNVIGKYPWSSSGRGLFSGNEKYKDSFIKRCLGSIRHQGSVLIEKTYDVVMDFAMLFYIHPNKKVEFAGFSLFRNKKRTYYCNLLLSQEKIRDEISTLISIQELNAVKEKISLFLSSEITDSYVGPLGIDMFVYKTNLSLPGSNLKSIGYKLNPCVEINLRHTMGFVALALIKQHLPKDFQGIFKISSKENFHNSHCLDLNPWNSEFNFSVYSL